MFDIAVAGGGPAGSAAAALLARDHDVVVFEEHPSIGHPVQCAGLLTEEAIRLTGVSLDVLSEMHGAEVLFPDGGKVRVRSDRILASSIDRADLDSRMADRALAAGAEYRLSEKVRSFSIGDIVHLDTSSGTAGCRLLVGADGHSSRIADSLGDNAPREYLRGIQAVVSESMDQDTFRIRLGSRYAPGFFTWEIPCGDVTRVGLCTSWSAGPPKPYLDRLLSDMGWEGRVKEWNCGKIPLGRRRTVSGDRVMLIGDAAAQVKPVSAGGIYPAMVSAPVLCRVATSCLSSDDLSGRALSEYDRGLKALWKEIDRAYRLRRMFVRMDDDDLSRAGRYAARDDVSRILCGIDLDHPADLIGEVLRHPSTAIAGVCTALRCLL